MVEPDWIHASWRKSSRSNGTSNCVEYATYADLVAIRDSKDPEGPILTFDAVSWRAFIDGVKNGEFDPLNAERPAF